ncbi:MAG: hypothetical protein JSS65_00340 [Armatimonadetes bacterium]|nr:hypothetical protein [Armatimonadota bacterium]
MKAVPRRTFTLALALVPGIGGKSVTRTLTRNDLLGRSPEEFCKLGLGALQEEYKLSAKAATAWHASPRKWIEEAEDLLARLDPYGVTLVTAADAHYPRLVEALDPDPPGVLYLYGNTALLEARTFCVLLSRNAPGSALAEAEAMTEDGVLQARTLVSSHDTPEYQRTAVVPLRWGAPRIMVLDSGFFKALGEDLKDEPFPAARLWRFQFDARTDLAVSAVHPFRPFHPNANRVRDRLVAGLSQEVALAWVSGGGNMEKLAKLAIRAGRPVYVSTASPAYEVVRAAGGRPVEPRAT